MLTVPQGTVLLSQNQLCSSIFFQPTLIFFPTLSLDTVNFMQLFALLLER